MARVLFLTQVFPYPLDAGPKVRQYHMLRHLAARHEVTLVSFVRRDDTAESLAEVRRVVRAAHTVPIPRSLGQDLRAGLKGLMTGEPLTLVRDESARMAVLLREVTEATAFDVVHADQLSMSAHGLRAASLAARLPGRARPRALLDEHNAIYALTRRMADTERRTAARLIMAREAGAFARYERKVCREYDAVLTVTGEDREQLLALYGAEERRQVAGRISVVPICVDPEQVAPVEPRPDGAGPVILHLGTMFWPPNVNGVLWFAREVLPLVWRQVPAARFVVAGKNPPPEVQALGADPRIEVVGYVADARPYLERAGVFVVPLHAGGGMRVKILDAWLWGLPIVSTPLGAEGIRVVDGENLLIGQDAETFGQAVARALTDEALNRRLRVAGRAWVETHYAWQRVYEGVDRVYEELLAGRGG